MLPFLLPVSDFPDIFFTVGIKSGAVFVVVALLAGSKNLLIIARWVVQMASAGAVAHFATDAGEMGGLLHRTVAALIFHSDSMAGDTFGVEISLDAFERVHSMGMIILFPGFVNLQKVKGQFLLTNEGTEVLEIKKPIRKSCGCTVPRLQTYTIKPGQSMPLYVTYTVGSHPGQSTKTISIDTRSPGTPRTLMLKVTANIKNIVNARPERFQFELQANPRREYTMELESTDSKPFKITNLISRNGVVTAEFDAGNETAHHTIPIKIDVDKLRGTRNGVITFQISHPKLKNVSIPFRVVLPFVAHPPTKTFLRLRPGQPQTASVKVISNFGEDFELGEISSAGGYIKVANTTRTDDGYQIKFTFTVPPGEKKSIFHDYLLIHIKDQPQNTIKLSCYGRVLKTRTKTARGS